MLTDALFIVKIPSFLIESFRFSQANVHIPAGTIIQQFTVDRLNSAEKYKFSS